ncbi:hypothetical protein NF865_04155 [Thermococcus aggregans]|uniref:Uncharacterized protein n=1 Tax=Thermococcus aggregans TaxID=110163 RepID=A0A9E7MZ30_THEAG|nr:hypothetical protein [Thermococcus aggregans]USS41387.1 hypothetical protein NF865_04155 [Thermococcus aggregans]
MVQMGAVNAFAGTIVAITKNPKLLLIPLMISIILSPISAYLVMEMPTFESFSELSESSDESIIFEEHGTFSQEMLTELADFFKFLLVFVLITFLLQALSQYAVIKGALLAEEGKEYLLIDLIYEGIMHVFQVFLITIIVGIIGSAILLLPLFLFSGLILLSGGSLVLLLLLILAEITLVLFVVGASSMAVPIYVLSNSISASLACFSLAFKNKLSSIAFGALLTVSSFFLLAVPASFIGLLFLGRTDFVANLIANILQAPFQALIQALFSIGGLMLYLEFSKRRTEEEVIEEFEV